LSLFVVIFYIGEKKKAGDIDLFIHYTKGAHGTFSQMFYCRGILLTTNLLVAQQTLVMVTHFFLFPTVSSFYIKMHPKDWWQWRDIKVKHATDFSVFLLLLKHENKTSEEMSAERNTSGALSLSSSIHRTL